LLNLRVLIKPELFNGAMAVWYNYEIFSKLEESEQFPCKDLQNE